MKLFYCLLPFGVVAALVLICYTPMNFNTYVCFRQVYSSGFSDSATAVVETRDSIGFNILYHSPERKFPTGAYYIVCSHSDIPHRRFYLNPSVVKVVPYCVFSARK